MGPGRDHGASRSGWASSAAHRVRRVLSGLSTARSSRSSSSRRSSPPWACCNITRGLALVISDVKPIYFDETPVTELPQVAASAQRHPVLRHPERACLIMFGAAIIASLMLTKTILGRYTFALGSNEEATRLSGVNVDRWKIVVYLLVGRLLRPRRHRHRRPPQLGPAVTSAWATSSTRSPRPSSAAPRSPAARAASSARSSARSSSARSRTACSIVGVPDQWKLVDHRSRRHRRRLRSTSCAAARSA